MTGDFELARGCVVMFADGSVTSHAGYLAS
jgi:hypothetical protein